MYIYEMHQHTAMCSACGKGDPEETVRTMKRDGFAGVVITEHFYHGNSAIDRSLPWEQFCAPYRDCYERMKHAGDEIDFDVFFGIEEGVGRGKEVLLYGLHPEFIFEHPELRDADLALISKLTRAAGGLVYQAHPFRDRFYIPDPDETLDEKWLDGIESFNACNPMEDNLKALAYAERLGLPQIAGSDAHTEYFPNRFGIGCTHRIRTEEELVKVLSAGDYELVR